MPPKLNEKEPELTGKYFEDHKIGEVIITPARTITIADIVNFAMFSGDWHPLHTDDVFASKSIFGGRIAHGPLTTTVITGLMMRAGISLETAMAFLRVEWKFILPVKVGDTIRARVEVVGKKETRKPDRGVIIWKIGIINQKDQIVCEGLWENMFKRRQKT